MCVRMLGKKCKMKGESSRLAEGKSKGKKEKKTERDWVREGKKKRGGTREKKE